MGHPLYVSIVWHMHQPYYKNLVTGDHLLPWARLHGTKDYLHMLEVLERHPRMRLTVNFVPCLLEQLEDYAERDGEDRYLRLSLAPVAALGPDDKRFLMEQFFSINHDRILRTYPRYAQLLDLATLGNRDVGTFGDAFWQDLRAWFNLAWIDPNRLEQDPTLRALVAKGRDFTDADIRTIIDIQRAIIRQIVPTARRLIEAGQLECSTTPYYHPIGPLLVDTRAALEAVPGLPLPSTRYEHVEDAAEQIRLAVDLHRRFFGEPPSGVWPAEGSVSGPFVALLAKQPSVRWIATDEAILSGSTGHWVERDAFGHVNNPRFLYRPYAAPASSSAVTSRTAMIFRDHHLSDRIGFVYQGWHGVDAANDFIHRLEVVRDRLGDDQSPYLVAVILDGENCWEGYEHNGDVFLDRLYEQLPSHPSFEPTTLSAYLERFPPTERLDHIRAGSWINGDFRVWIGEAAQNQAWDLLKQTRDRLVAWQKQSPLADLDVLEKAWREIYIAEGSDWFWWYYSHNNSAQDPLFDAEFRQHLANVYRVIGLPVPQSIYQPIEKIHRPLAGRPITGLVAPPLNGADQAAPEWAAAGQIEPTVTGGVMQRTQGVLAAVYYGFNREAVVFRLETTQPAAGYRFAIYLAATADTRLNNRVRFAGTNPATGRSDVAVGWEIAVEPPASHAAVYRADGDEQWVPIEADVAGAVSERAIEIAIPRTLLRLQTGDSLRFVAAVSRDGVLIESLPVDGPTGFTFDADER